MDHLQSSSRKEFNFFRSPRDIESLGECHCHQQELNHPGDRLQRLPGVIQHERRDRRHFRGDRRLRTYAASPAASAWGPWVGQAEGVHAARRRLPHSLHQEGAGESHVPHLHGPCGRRGSEISFDITFAPRENKQGFF